MKSYPKYKPSGEEWLKTIPDHWEAKPLKYELRFFNNIRVPLSAEERGKMQEKTYDYYGASGIIDKVENYLFEGNYILLGEDGANLIARNSPLAFKASGKFWVNNHAHILQPITGNLDYFVYLLESYDFFPLVSGSAQPKLTLDNVESITLPVPPIIDQEAIASFLDDKTIQIDTLIEKKQKLIELLKEERQAVINEAVTKGINPKAKVKPSGVEWLGDIPEHWEVKKISTVSEVVRGASPRPAGDPRYFSQETITNGTNWITVGELTKDTAMYLTETSTYLTQEGKFLSRLIEINTLLLSNSGATLGVPKITKLEGCINDGSVAFLNLARSIDIQFLYYFLFSITKLLRDQAGQGMGQPNLNTTLVKNIAYANPPIEEQKEIVAFLEQAIKNIDNICKITEKEIELMQEYRTALITEVVTGKMCVI